MNSGGTTRFGIARYAHIIPRDYVYRLVTETSSVAPTVFPVRFALLSPFDMAAGMPCTNRQFSESILPYVLFSVIGLDV